MTTRGLKSDEREGGRVWRVKPNIEPPGLEIGGTCGFPPADSSGGLREAGETEVEGLEGPGVRVSVCGRIWRAKPNIEPSGLDIGGTCGNPPAGGSGGLCEAGETGGEGVEGPGARVGVGGRV